MTSFSEIFNGYTWEAVTEKIYSVTKNDVLSSLAKEKRTIDDFLNLISPAAAEFLPEMANLSHEATKKRFGKTIQMYTPIYLSNECNNICTYCGFSFDNKLKRKTLTDAEIIQEIKAIKEQGFNHVLLVTGEANHTVHVDYFEKAINLIKPFMANISIEVQPLEQEEYERLQKLGVYSVLVYQETYNINRYKEYHPKGKKSNFQYRLETPDNIGRAKIHKIGLGVLLGLEDWRVDSFFCALHLDYLQKTYWQTKYSISFPRIRPAEGTNRTNFHLSDKELVQLLCAYRLFNNDVELSISTRESEKFRNNVIKLGTTTMSAGSKTNPGGYSVEPDSLEQFEISDERGAKEFANIIKQQGYEAVWKDWDKSFV